MRNPRAPQISRQYTQSYKPQNGGTAPQNGPLKFHKGKKAPGITPNPSPHKPFNPQSNLAALICSRIPLGMNNISCLEFSSFLKSYMARKKSKSLTFPQFKEMMKICKPFDIDEDIYEENLMKLFRLVDLNQNGKADRTEIANILILLTNGEKKDKIKAAFNFYDANRNGTLDREELTDYFTGVMKLKWKDTPKLMNLKEADIKLIAASTAKNCFDTIDQDGSGQVSLKEFTEWILNGGQSQATDKIRQTQFTDIHRKFEKDNALETINKIREGVPFEQIHISIAYHLLNNRTKELKALDKTQFKDFLKHLVSKTGIKVKFSDGFDNIPALFFNIFDYSNNGILDKEELGLGLFILCGKKSFNFRREKEREIEVLSSVV
jgi:Ca2+-binding EF-hand superfamily protein